MIQTLLAFWEKLGPEITQRTVEHIYLTVIALVIAIAIALPLGILLAQSKRERLSSAVLSLAGVIQTIPSLAMLALIVLLFVLLSRPAFISLPTIGFFPAIVALFLYALLPILRNTCTSIRQVDPSVIEVATGMGMRPSQVLFTVKLPLSLPVIMAGIRISTVWTIGVATLTGLIGAGGLGDLIIKGLRAIQMDYLIAGTIPAALLAIIFDWGLSLLERWLSPRGARSNQ